MRGVGGKIWRHLRAEERRRKEENRVEFRARKEGDLDTKKIKKRRKTSSILAFLFHLWSELCARTWRQLLEDVKTDSSILISSRRRARKRANPLETTRAQGSYKSSFSFCFLS